jgi:glycosyltransferase involved in cell wall biosynthesis
MTDTRTNHLAHLAHLAVVAIGRNEGERLVRCLQSLRGRAGLVVYVDSGSTDGSLQVARSSGAEVVGLDMSSPFTAARARNAGLARALERRPDLEYVQFVDGDCEVVPGWLEAACSFLVEHPRAAVATGLRRERYPERSVYNLLCDLDWNPHAAGIVKSCGGDAMMRVAALEAVGRYRPDLVAGEEPELCVRLRAAGWEIHALGVPMTLHDAAMTRFAQWWMRTLRTGYAYAQGVCTARRRSVIACGRCAVPWHGDWLCRHRSSH